MMMTRVFFWYAAALAGWIALPNGAATLPDLCGDPAIIPPLNILASPLPSSWFCQIGADIDGSAIQDFSGSSVSLSADGKTVAIGAYANDGFRGHVRVYAFDGGSWSQLGQDIDGEAARDFFGRVSLSADGKTVAIGAPNNDDNGLNSGHVRVYMIESLLTRLKALAQADSEAQATISEQASKLNALAQANSEAQATISEQASKLNELAQANSTIQTTIAQNAQDLQALKDDILGLASTIDENSSESSKFITPLAGGAAALACAGLVLAGLALRGRSANIKSSDEFAVSSKA